MNKIISLVILIFIMVSNFFNICYGQEKIDSLYSNNLYFRALVTCIDTMSKAYGKVNDSYGGSIRTDYNNMIIEKDDITFGFPNKYASYNLNYMDSEELIAKYKIINREFSILKIFPMRTTGSNLIINITLYWVKYENNNLNLAISDGCEVEFAIDCLKKEFIISKVKLWGI